MGIRVTHCPAGDCKAIWREGDRDHKFNIAPNLLDRDFNTDAPNQKWAGDISDVWPRESRLDLVVILDLHSRQVIGWAVRNRMKRNLAIRALKMAIAFRTPPKGCIPHTDRGSHYGSHDDQKILRQHGVRVSMSGTGAFYDTAAVETVFKTIKMELVWRRAWETRRQAKMAIFEYITGFYNPRRRHSAPGWNSPPLGRLLRNRLPGSGTLWKERRPERARGAAQNRDRANLGSNLAVPITDGPHFSVCLPSRKLGTDFGTLGELLISVIASKTPFLSATCTDAIEKA